MTIPLNSKGYTIAAWAGLVLMAVTVVWLGLQGKWLGFAICLAFVVAATAFITMRSEFPALFDLLFVIAALANGAGWVWELYTEVFAYDEIVHAYTTFAASLSLGFALYYSMSAHFRPAVYAVSIVTVGIALGALWEIFEWLIINIRDPVPDLIVDTLGAIIAGIFGARVLTREARRDQNGGRN